jgi:DNA-binding NarL/FixJ family response regulator
MHFHHHPTLEKHFKHFKSTLIKNNVQSLYSSTGYTSEGSTCCENLVSKYIDFTGDLNMKQIDIDARSVHLHFNRDIAESYFTEELQEKLNVLPNRIIFCKSWTELTQNIKLKPNSVSFSSKELINTPVTEIINMISTLATLVGVDKPISVSICINKDNTYSLIKELQKSNVIGIVPCKSEFGSVEAEKGLRAQWANIPYWPKDIIEQLPGAIKSTVDNSIIKLTPRQEQIFTIIKTKGASNKAIAKMLNITESTVKLHMGQILKKYGVKNRTQLVAFNKHEV